jgi:hypothetical protein
MTTKRNRLLNFIIGLFLSLYVLTGSIFTIVNDVNIDLSKSKQIVGQVIYTDVREISNFTIRWTTYRRVFYFRLDNSNQKFAVHNSYEGYDDLRSNIRIGDTIKVYYGSTLLDDYNRRVFQIEKNGNILINYQDYDKSASGKAGIGLFLGTILLMGFIMWFKRINILKFLNSLVKP